METARLLLLVAWAGSLWTVGLVIAPTLFATLDDPALAGRLAARFFTIETWLSLAAALAWWPLAPAGAALSRWLAIAIALVLSIMHFVVAPVMGRFEWGHSLAAGLYLLACVVAGALVFSCRNRAE